jgi:hypothetical protein
VKIETRCVSFEVAKDNALARRKIRISLANGHPYLERGGLNMAVGQRGGVYQNPKAFPQALLKS